MSICTKCPDRATCMSLCEKAEEYVNQDYASQKEITIGIPLPRELDIHSSVYFTKTEREIVTLLGKGLTREDVCQVLDISRGALRIHFYRLKKKCNDFNI